MNATKASLAGFSLLALTLGLSACNTMPVRQFVPVDTGRALAGMERSEKDAERDRRDNPAGLLALLDLRRGMRVADVFGGGGYYSELLAQLVGPQGEVLLINNQGYQDYLGQQLEARLANDRLPQVRALVRANEDLGLGEEALDAVLLINTLHDLYYEELEQYHWPDIDEGQFLGQIFAALKPGGRLLIADHSAAVGAGTGVAKTLHRIEESVARNEVEAAGFELLIGWDGQRNAEDDRSRIVFDEAIRGRTDRFVHVYRKPGAGPADRFLY